MAAGIPAAAGLPASALMVQSGREPLLVRHADEKLLPQGQGQGRYALLLCRYVLGTNHYQIEMLANLDQMPESGALVMVSFPKPQRGTGFPARVVAILP